MVEHKSAYEKQRDSNVQRNNAFLAAIGLDAGIVPPKPRKIVKKRNDIPNDVPTRASSRQSKAVVRFEQLSDDYFAAHEPESEEDDINRVSKRVRTKATYFQPTTLEGVAVRRVVAKKNPVAAELTSKASVSVSPQQLANSGVAPLQLTDDPDVKAYYAAGKKGQCPLCLDWFCVRKSDGMLHSHHCRPVNVKAPLAPLLPAM